MANIKSAKKRIGVTARKTAINKRTKGHLREVIKAYDKAIADNDLTLAEEQFALAEKRLMKAATKGVVHKNTASRKVSRMAKQLQRAKAE